MSRRARTRRDRRQPIPDFDRPEPATERVLLGIAHRLANHPITLPAAYFGHAS